jgi:hypothetical protein
MFSILYANAQIYSKNEFGAYYSRIHSGEEFEAYARVGNHADIIVDVGTDGMTFNFWRGASYLPYLQTASGRFYVDEVIERNGDGSGIMPDKTNFFSYVQIISSSPEQVVVHWRYLPQFQSGNPKKGVATHMFVDEYFYIRANGRVKRIIKQGTSRIDDWENSDHQIIQTFNLTKKGIKDVQFLESVNVSGVNPIQGSPIVMSEMKPALHWAFDEGEGNNTAEMFTQYSGEVSGRKTLWRKGVSGTALQFDGYYSELRFPDQHVPEFKESMTIEAWIALGAYPWNEVPIVQQMDDYPEKRSTVKEVKGYYLGIDGFGYPVFKINIGGDLLVLKVIQRLERRKWYHIMARHDKVDGFMRLYLNGDEVAKKECGHGLIHLSDNPVCIGKGKNMKPTRPVRSSSYPDSYSVDGLIDEIKIYNSALSKEQIIKNYNSYLKNEPGYSLCDMDPRDFPVGQNRNQFGAYYTHLKYHDSYDNLWCVGNHSDVVVEFEENPTKFIFWRGVSYIPMMVNEKGQWYSNEFNETWGKSGGEGCQEPMSDKGAYTNHVRIIENTPARTVIHWRYPLLDVNHVIANYNEKTGWGDWSDWYYYIYPDGVAVKTMRLWTSGERNHEWQESMVILSPDQHPEDIICKTRTLTMMNLKGDEKIYDWLTAPPEKVNKPKNKCIQIVNYTGEYRPVTIGEFGNSDVYKGEKNPYSVFPTWNHWPIAQIASDGRYASFPDRAAHCSLTHVKPAAVYKEDKNGPTPFYEKLLMESMMNKGPETIVILAKSWLQAPEIIKIIGAKGNYDPAQRAYVLEKEKEQISFSLQATKNKPLKNLAIVVKHWNTRKQAEVLMNGQATSNKQGVFRDADGSESLVIWMELTCTDSIRLRIKG